ncbi:lysylphosphatidylglycerol synthase domain-containing protein [Virgibacillus halophilus]|uniref:Phosphatidylglycerol lysyltransferase n=1 Tax=Tigheibacillus halophilus TaxID=361280 RepID=A0ABU5C9B5_9BACI|nr:lysylphosphatidylglycerol synthase domain-containing protein [Virgibacillus halophilus]
MNFFTPKLTLQYSAVSVIEWFGAGLVLYFSLVAVDAPVSFGQAFGLYTIAAVMGVISMIPGGFGSFDLMVLSGGQLLGAEPSILLTALLMYRFAYYMIPLIFGLIIMAFEMSSTVVRKAEDSNLIAPVVEISGVIWALQRMILKNIGYWSLSLLSFITGLFLLFIPIFDIIAYHAMDKSRLSLLTIDFYNILLFALAITIWFFYEGNVL